MIYILYESARALSYANMYYAFFSQYTSLYSWGRLSLSPIAMIEQHGHQDMQYQFFYRGRIFRDQRKCVLRVKNEAQKCTETETITIYIRNCFALDVHMKLSNFTFAVSSPKKFPSFLMPICKWIKVYDRSSWLQDVFEMFNIVWYR